jgi:formate hydrogenlyase subunit 3/multisubunit Na+/H+ antiporter MnhD subunit
MSGVLIKMGIYGLLRVMLLLQGPLPFFGPLLIVLGLAGGAVGIACSLYQRDIKRTLAYSSVENVGLILMALGIALWGLTSHRPMVAALGLTGGLLHVWNHAVMKGLMFLGAGSLVLRCHSRDIERLGGLFRRMPQTASAMLIGATAMAGLPPLNGFVSEWLMYLGLLYAALQVQGGTAVAVLVTIAAVSLIGAMAALCFARLIGVALLGAPRSQHAERASEASPWMTLPMLALAATALAIALFPATFVTLLRPVLTQLLGTPSMALSGLGRLHEIGAFNCAILLILVIGAAATWLWQSRKPVSRDETWGCGFIAPTARMQYTGRGFSELFTSNLLPRVFGPRVTTGLVANPFPIPTALASDTTDPVTRGVYEPFFERWASRFSRLRFMQQGILHVYLLYILVTLLVALAFSTIMSLGDLR